MAFVLHQVSGHEDVRVTRTQPLVYHDPPVRDQPGVPSQCDTRTDARRDQHSLDGELPPVLEPQPLHPPAAQELRYLGAQEDGGREPFDDPLKQSGPDLVELPGKQAGQRLDNSERFQLRRAQVPRSLQSQQPAAHHGGL